MTNRDISKRIACIFSESDFCIIYKPLSTEIDPVTLPFELPIIRIAVPADPSVDPKKLSASVTDKLNGLDGIVIVPGRKFDIFGGRRGKGWGWYDRFLSAIPARWTRIGICPRSAFLDTRMKLQEWDEVMDWVAVSDNGRFSFYDTRMAR